MKIFNQLKQEPIVFLFRKVWRFSEGNRKRVTLFTFLFVLAVLVSLLNPILFATFLNELQRNGLSAENFWYLTLIMSGYLWLTLLFWLFHGTGRMLELKNAFYLRHKYQMYLMKGVLALDLAWHTSRDSGDTIDKVNKAAEALSSYSKNTHQVVALIVNGIGTIAALIYFSGYMAIGALAFVMFGFYVIRQFDKRLVPQYAELNKQENKILAKVFDVLSNVTSIIVLKIKGEAGASIEKSILVPRDLYNKNIALNEWKWFVASIFLELVVLLPLIAYLALSLSAGKVLEVGTISALYMYLSRFRGVFSNFTFHYEEIIRKKTKVMGVENIEGDFPQKEMVLKRRKAKKELRIEHLHFSYQKDDVEKTNDLHDVSVTLNKGEKIALIGESGSGKTTFLKVLHGLYPAAEAGLVVDGTKLKGRLSDYDFGTMLVPQEPELFSSSIRENITFGLDHSDEEVFAFTDMAHFTKVLHDLPKGLESVVNEKGVNLSGGQKQRLALSRALLFAQQKEIILLDESTSSVDPQTEVKIYRNIFSFFKGKTIVATIHKLHLLKYFDRVIIFNKGVVEDAGSFDELLSRNAAFRRAWEEYNESVPNEVGAE